MAYHDDGSRPGASALHSSVWLLRLSIAMVCCAAQACRSPATQIQLYIDTDVPPERALSLEVFSFNGAIETSQLPARASRVSSGIVTLQRGDGGANAFVPGGSIGILPPMDRTNNRVTLWLRMLVAGAGGAPPISLERAATVSFSRGVSGSAQVFLAVSCGDLALGCTTVPAADCTVARRCTEQNATCSRSGGCIAAELEVQSPDGGSPDVTVAALDVSVVRADAIGDPDAGRCGPGMEPLGDGCVVIGAYPRPISPLSLGDVSLFRPTMRWQLPAGMDGAAVELCRDRGCTMVLESARARGESARPAMELPPSSVVFWRLRGTSGTETSLTYSPTWLFHVPVRDNSGSVDTSSNAHLDLNGDGIDEVAVGADGASPGGRMNAGTVSIFQGTRTGPSRDPSIVLEGTSIMDRFGTAVRSAGDVNGDGFGDLLVGSRQAAPDGRRFAGSVSVYLGGVLGIQSVPSRVLEGQEANDFFGFSVGGAGDVNRDGYGDIVVGSAAASPGGHDAAGAAYVFHGASDGIEQTPARTLNGFLANAQFGFAVTGAGDVNGDGYGDIAVGAFRDAPFGRANAGTVSVFHGSPRGIPAAEVAVFEGRESLDLFGVAVSSAGDLNADGFGDLVVGAVTASPSGRTRAGSASVFLGSRNGLISVPQVLEGDAENDQFGNSVSGGGDLDGDGFGDLVVGAFNASIGARSAIGTASVYFGTARGVEAHRLIVHEGIADRDAFGHSVAMAGDVNGDGLTDLIVGAREGQVAGRMNAGTASLFYGRRIRAEIVRSVLFEGLAPNDQFGYWVADAKVGDSDIDRQILWTVVTGVRPRRGRLLHFESLAAGGS